MKDEVYIYSGNMEIIDAPDYSEDIDQLLLEVPL